MADIENKRIVSTIDEKLDLFSKIIYEEIYDEEQEKIENINIEREKRITELRNELSENKERSIESGKKKLETKYLSSVSKEKTLGNQEILLIKESFVEEIYEGVRKKLIDFTNSNEYKTYILNKIVKTLDELDKGNYIIYVTEHDYKFKDEIQGLDSEIVEVQIKDNILGGFLIESKGGNFRVDESFLNYLTDNKKIIGLKIEEYLK